MKPPVAWKSLFLWALYVVVFVSWVVFVCDKCAEFMSHIIEHMPVP